MTRIAAIIAAALTLGCVFDIVWQEYHVEPLSTVQTIKIEEYHPVPQTIDVIGQQWTVKEVTFPDDGSMQGWTNCAIRQILLSSRAMNPRDALLHELLHAAVCQYDRRTKDWHVNNLYYNSKSSDEHEGIYRVAAVVSDLLARNPDLAEWESEGDVSVGKVTVK